MGTRDISRRTASKKGYSLSSTYGKRTSPAPKTVSVSASSFGISGAGSNTSLLKKFGSPEAKSATASSVTKLTATQQARYNSIPKTALQEGAQINSNSPTSNVQGLITGNIITGDRYNFLAPNPSPTVSGVTNIAQAKRQTQKTILQEEEQKKKSFLDKFSGFVNKIADVGYLQDSRLFGGFLPGGPTPKYVSSLRKLKETEAINNAITADAQERIQKASMDAQAEKAIAEQENISDLYDTSLLEKFGIGRSAEEKRIQELIAQNAYYNQQAQEAQSLAEAFQRSEQASANPLFQGAVAAAPTATKNDTIKNIAIAGAVGLGLLFLLKK